MIETPPLPQEIVVKKEPLDAQWYDRFEKCGSFQAYEYFNGEKSAREQEQADFFSGKKENPSLDYPDLDSEKIKDLETELLRLKSDILGQEKNEVVRQVYRWKINEKIAEARLLRSAEQKNQKRFRRYSEFIYGKPSAEIFSYTLANIRRQAEDGLYSKEPSISQLAQELLSALPVPALSTHFSPPNQEALSAASKEVEGSFHDILSFPAEKGELTAENIKEVFTVALEKINALGWGVEISKSSKSAISVNQEMKKVIVPESRRLSVNGLRRLIVHEIGTHALRRVNGERTKLRLLGLGLDRYEAAEEGVATMREQALNKKASDFSGLDGHLAIALAYGTDGKPRNFRSVFEILEKYYSFLNISHGLPAKESSEAAKRSAWNRCVRTFRGTSCEIPGICFTKDIIYREGNIAMWEIVSKKHPEMTRFNIGKYDPSNARHIWILEQLNITDDELAELEK